MTNSTVMGERGSNIKVREKKYLYIWCSGGISSSLVIVECAKTLSLILALLVCSGFVNTEKTDHGTLMSESMQKSTKIVNSWQGSKNQNRSSFA